jgi:hypothetical protein
MDPNRRQHKQGQVEERRRAGEEAIRRGSLGFGLAFWAFYGILAGKLD